MAERASRDAEIRRTFANPESARHEAAATSELDRSYPHSRAVAGDDGPGLAPGRLLPDTRPVEPAVGEAASLHELTHNPGLTLLVLAGPEAEPGPVGDVVAQLSGRGPVVSAVHGLAARLGGESVGRIDGSTAAQLGVAGLTVFAVRPDRFVGFRDNGGRPDVVKAYLDALVA